MNYKTINTLTGWGVFAIALITYLMTVAPTASFWDCGEFIASANELEVTHPPGAPLFMILGRIFAMLAPNQSDVAFMVNLISAISSAFTALFITWTVTMLARKGLAGSEMPDREKTITIMAAGVVAGLSTTFADSIWFNAVEAEVYAMSSFFTAIVVWLMLKWENHADEPGNQRWIILIAYVMGLSIGVHLLNLLTIPVLALIYFFRKFPFSWKGLFATLGISVGMLAFVQYGIIQYTFSLAWRLEQFFTGTMTRSGKILGGLGMPMGTGTVLLFALGFVTILGLLLLAQRKRSVLLQTATLGLTMIMLGFSSYLAIYIRSNVNPPIDMNNPENILTFLSYMKREQYGDRPLLRGPLYNAQPQRDSRGYAKTTIKGKKYILLDAHDRYVEDTDKIEYQYADRDKVWFPRMYDPGRYNSGPFAYKNFVRRKGKDRKSPYDDKPTKAEDWKFFFAYQLNHMYWRYFMWNFAGRESDIQEAPWESGLEGLSEQYRSSERRKNKARNHYFFLPLLIGLLGLVWQVLHDKKNAFVVGMLFFFTGIAIVIYLNQYPLQPRERDYSFAGSFQTFAIWIGLGVLFFAEMLRLWIRRGAVWIAAGLCLLAPILMASQNWDDHSRKGRWIDIEFAKNLLDSCDKNAILFTAGDNDTFPLWYVQEVEDYRSDVRVVNLELLISDWYIDNLKIAQNESAALPITMERDTYAGEKSIITRPYPSRKINLPVHTEALVERGVLSPAEGLLVDSVMVWNFKVRGGKQNPYILRKDSVILNLVRNIARDEWRRPLYFSNTMSPSNFAGLADYFRLEGMAFRVLPVKRSDQTINDMYNGRLDRERMRKNMIEVFSYRGLDDPSVSFDEHIRKVIIGNYRNSFFRYSNSFVEPTLQARKQISELQLALGSEGANDQAIRQAIVQMKDELKANREAVREAMAFSEQAIPHSAIPRNLTLLITQMQLLDRMGIDDLASAEFERMKTVSLENLEAAKLNGRKIDGKNLSMRGLLIGIQYLMANGKQAEASALATELENLTGKNIRSQLFPNS